MPTQAANLPHSATPLRDITFCVVDLETTGGSPRSDRVTEVGVVKVRGGEVVGELQTLVDPGTPIPTSISALTGITTSMVSGRPPLEAVLPTLLEFCRGTALVAHNARFDTGFLNAGLARLDYPRLDHPVLCTAALARRLVRDEVRNFRLATLAHHFRCPTEPTHRALQDARATVEVLHALLERAGSFGVLTLEDLLLFTSVRNTALFKARHSLLADLPRAPGVYLFRSASGEILYVGKATDLRARVRSYFASDDRRKIVDLLKEAAAIEHVRCSTPVEAAIREARLIAEHRPRFNQRGKPRQPVYLTLTQEAFPRLSIVRRRPADRPVLGPFGSRRTAVQILDAIHEAVPIRRCTDRLGPRTRFPACALAEIGRCPAPCEGRIEVEAYAEVIAPAHATLAGDPTIVVAVLRQRMQKLAQAGRYEEAASVRDRLFALVHALQRGRRRAWVTGPSTVAASRPLTGQRVEVVLLRHGRLVASATCQATEVDQVLARLSADPPDMADRDAAGADEAEILARWLERRGVRVLHAEGSLAAEAGSGRLLAETAADLTRARRSTGRSDDELAAKRLRRSA